MKKTHFPVAKKTAISTTPSSETAEGGRDACVAGSAGSRQRDRPELFSAAHYWSSRCYSWSSGAPPCRAQRSEVVNNSAGAEIGAVECSNKILSHRCGRDTLRSATNVQRTGALTLVTILSSGTGRALIRNESSGEDPSEAHTIMLSCNQGQRVPAAEQNKVRPQTSS
jgi:hypothetical protein